MPEPLKGRIHHAYKWNRYEWTFHFDDVNSAVEWLLKELDRVEKDIERSYKELKTRNEDEYESWLHAIVYFRFKLRQAFAGVFENDNKVSEMSYTGIYSVLFDKGGEEGVEIKNWKGFVEFMKKEGFAVYDVDGDKYVIGSGYPRAEIKVVLEDLDEKPKVILLGFRSWSTEIHDEYNIERLACYYDRSEFESFWRELSKYTEPFWFLHSTIDGYVPTLFEAFLEKDHRDIFKVECENGRIVITKIDFKPEPTEKEGEGDVR